MPGGFLTGPNFGKGPVDIRIQIDAKRFGFDGGYILKGKLILLHSGHTGRITINKGKKIEHFK